MLIWIGIATAWSRVRCSNRTGGSCAAHKHYLDNRRARETEHLVIEYCKKHLDEWIIHALAVAFRDERAEEGVDRS